MYRHGLDEHVRIITGDYTEEAGAAAARTMLAGTDLPAAAVAVNDRSAVGLLDSLARNGVDVPGELSVAGYDDSILSRLTHIHPHHRQPATPGPGTTCRTGHGRTTGRRPYHQTRRRTEATPRDPGNDKRPPLK